MYGWEKLVSAMSPRNKMTYIYKSKVYFQYVAFYEEIIFFTVFAIDWGFELDEYRGTGKFTQDNQEIRERKESSEHEGILVHVERAGYCCELFVQVQLIVSTACFLANLSLLTSYSKMRKRWNCVCVWGYLSNI